MTDGLIVLWPQTIKPVRPYCQLAKIVPVCVCMTEIDVQLPVHMWKQALLNNEDFMFSANCLELAVSIVDSIV